LTNFGQLKVVKNASLASFGTGMIISTGDVEIQGGMMQMSGIAVPSIVPLISSQGSLSGLFDVITGCTAGSNQFVVGSTLYVNCTPASGGLSPAAIAGIAVGAVVVGAAAALGAVLIIKHQMHLSDAAANMDIRANDRDNIAAAYNRL
jgi:hypothetical protein